MFKGKGEFKNFVKKQVAKALAVVMAASTLLSSSMVVTPVQAANVAPAGTQAFIDTMVSLSHLPYKWGGTTEATGVDCRAYVKLALNKTFGTIYGYWVNEDGSLPGGTKTSVCLADWDPTVAQTLSYGPNNLGTNRICIEGNGKVAYFRVLAAGQSSGSNIRDIKYGSYTYSSLIAYACQFPGSIISHNGHCGVGLGEFHSASDLVARYPGLAGTSSGTAGGDKIRFAPAAYSMGNAYSMDNMKHWFGKTIFLSACSEKSGIRADNFTTSGKTPNPAANSTFAILQAESEIPMVEIHLSKVDAINKDKILGGATFGLYTSPTCEPNTLVQEIELVSEYAKITLPRGKYYLREEAAPKGYQKIDRVLPVDVTNGITKRIQFENNPVNATVIVQKVDKYDRNVVLNETKLELYEYNKNTDDYDYLVDLTYDSAIKAFTIKDSYTNNEGIRITDHSLHYSTTNNGFIQLRETEAHPGYENQYAKQSGDMKYVVDTYDITDPDDQLILTGDKAISNTAKLSLLVKKVSTSGKPLAGAKLSLNYGDVTYDNYESIFDNSGTNAQGITLYDDLMDSGYKAVLSEFMPPAGYDHVDNWREGKIINFQKGPSHLVTDPSQPDYGRFRTTITIKNAPIQTTEEEPALPEIKVGNLKIRKTDASRMDDFNVGVPEAKYSLFAVTYDDANKTFSESPVVAKVNGVEKEVTAIPTNTEGEILVEDLPIADNGSTYHLREVEAPENYAIQSKTFAINFMSDQADENNIVSLETKNVADARQTVKLNLNKIDEESDLGIADAVFELKNKTKLTLATTAVEVPEGTTLGYFKTDENGKLLAEMMGPAEFELPNGQKFNDDRTDFILADGTDISGQPLVNGVYELREVVAPKNYVLPEGNDAIIEIDALWRGNNTNEQITLPEGIVTPSGLGFIPNTITIREVRQSVEIELTKNDSVLKVPSAGGHYDVSTDDYDLAVEKGAAATLEGAEYALINTETIVDINTGDQIEAGTTIAIETTDKYGKLTFTEMTEGFYAGHKIPTGKYKIVEVTPPQGYTLSYDEIEVAGTEWTGIGATIRIDGIEAEDEILKQDLKVNKVSSLDGSAVAGAKFAAYSAIEFESYTGTGVPMNNGVVDCDAFMQLVEQHNVPAIMEDVVSNAQGVALFEGLIYGEYVIVETEIPSGYQQDCPAAAYVKLPCVEDEVADEKFFVYDFVAHPEGPFEITVENVPEEVEYTAAITIQKVDEEGNIITNSEATFKLMDADGNELETANTTNGELTFATKLTKGEYKLEEVSAPIGYEGKTGIGTIVAGDDSITLTWPNETPVQTTPETLSGNVEKTFQVTNTPMEGFDIDFTLKKVDSTTNETITSSETKFGLYTTSGTLIEETQTTNGIANFATKLVVGEYIVIELESPTGYNRVDSEVSIKVTKDSVSMVPTGDELWEHVYQNAQDFTGTTEVLLPFPNDPIVEEVSQSVIFRKYEVIDAEHKTVPGATLQILDKFGNVVVLDDGTVCEWITEDNGEHVDEFGVSGHLIDKLQPGEYKLHEVEAPDGYAVADDVPFTVEANVDKEVEMIESPLKLNVQKVDATSGEQIVGAKLELVRKNKAAGENIQWVSDGTTKTFEYVSAGNYAIVETEAPEGYYFETAETGVFIDETYDGIHMATIENMRKTGQLKITKMDSKNPEIKLEGVEFQLTSKYDVVDPLTNEVIFNAGDVVATLITDRNGFAETVNTLPIATFDANGLKDYIVYELTETKTAPGQYVGNASVEVKFMETEETKGDKVIVKDLSIQNYKPSISVVKTGTPKTYEGPYADKKDVTVVENGDTITYTVSVTNNGDATGHNIVVKDAIPENTKFSSFKDIHNAEYDAEKDTMYWNIEQIAVGETVDLVFNVTVDNEKACEIANVAQYAYPDYIPTGAQTKPYLDPKGNNEWADTNYVVHQTVEFHKTSQILGGSKKDDAVLVGVGDTIKYILTFKSTNDVKNLVVTDKIPDGLTYVSGSAENWLGKDTGATYNPQDRVLTFSTFESVQGDLTYSFDVTVDDVELGAPRTDFENQAIATYNDGLGETVVLPSEKITHYTHKDLKVTKTADPKTFEGVAAEAKDVTVLMKDEVVTYTITVDNTGATTLKNIVVEDVVPTGLKYISNATDDESVKVWVASDNSKLTWAIPELKAGNKVNLTFKASVIEQKAQLIVNNATYGLVENVGEDAPALPSGSAKTNDVVHQVIDFHKTSEVKGGTDKKDAVLVEVGDTITYILEINTKHAISGVELTDPLPEGLSFVEGSTYLKAGNGDWQLEEGIKVGDGGVGSVIVRLGNLPAGQYFFKFDTTVDKVPLNEEQFYINQATLECHKFTNDKSTEPKTETLSSDKVSHTTYYALKGTKDGKVETYVGPYDARKNVTVVENGDEIVYTITIENVGKAKMKNVIIQDKVPENTEFIKADKDGELDKKTGIVTWNVANLEVDKPISVTMTVKVDCDDKAVEIRNKAAFAMADKAEDVKEKDWIWTDEVVHQTVELHKTASIDHGVDKEDAKSVKIGTEFDYIITFEAKDPVYGLKVSDVIPDGLSFVEGTAKYEFEDEDAVKVKDLKVDKDNTLIFPEIEEVAAGKTTFTFTVKVEDVEEYDKDYFFVNQATASVKTNEDSKDTVDLETETVSNKTIKTNKTETPKLGFETMDENTMWIIVSVISAIAMIGFGWYGFVDGKKKRK